MTVPLVARFVPALVLVLGLVLPFPSRSAPPGFFESLRNRPDTNPERSKTDTEELGSPPLRPSSPAPDTTLRGDTKSPDPDSSPEPLQSPAEHGTPDTSARVVIPPSNSTLRGGSQARSREPTDTGVQFSRVGRAFEHGFYVGVRWPGVSAGVRKSPYALEVKFLEDSEDVEITGLRLYHHLLRIEGTNVYWGMDLASISFEGDVSEGSGTSTGFFGGFEKRLWDRFSWSLDLGPYHIHLRDDDTDLTAEGLEFTLTTAINVGFL